jgi:hypothetical protein
LAAIAASVGPAKTTANARAKARSDIRPTRRRRRIGAKIKIDWLNRFVIPRVL